MRQKRTRAHQTPGHKSRAHPAARIGFVSYCGVGSVKPKVKQNVNTPRIPYEYTNKQKWHTFITNGRPKFHKCCLLLCDVIHESESYSFWEESHSHLPGEHAEVKALRHISMEEQEAGTNARIVALYMSYSPCASCADFIIDFSRSRPKCQLCLGFSCLYRHEEELHRDGLRRLAAAPRVFLGVFTNVEWKRLAEAAGISFRYHSPRRNSGDLKWKAEFENILKEQPGTTSSQLSVPSEETDRSSVFIPAIHFSQDRGPTFRAAANSGLSQGCVSGNQWPSPDERNDLSAARRVENPEARSITSRPFVPSQERDWSSVCIPVTHISQDQGSTSRVALSSNLLHGRVPRMWRQSRDEHREELLDAVSVESPQGNGTVTRRVNKRSVNYGILIVVIVVIGALILYNGLA